MEVKKSYMTETCLKITFTEEDIISILKAHLAVTKIIDSDDCKELDIELEHCDLRGAITATATLVKTHRGTSEPSHLS